MWQKLSSEELRILKYAMDNYGKWDSSKSNMQYFRQQLSVILNSYKRLSKMQDKHTMDYLQKALQIYSHQHIQKKRREIALGVYDKIKEKE